MLIGPEFSSCVGMIIMATVSIYATPYRFDRGQLRRQYDCKLGRKSLLAAVNNRL